MYVNFEDEIEYDILKKVAIIIKNGGIVIFPTETVYGIGADCFNSEAVKKITDEDTLVKIISSEKDRFVRQIAVNNIKNPAALSIGQELIIPVSQGL